MSTRVEVIQISTNFIEILVPGSPGSPGPPGVTGNTSFFIFTQNSALSTWTVPHNLGRRPSVKVRSPGGVEIETPEIVHTDINNLLIFFDVPFVGEAYCV